MWEPPSTRPFIYSLYASLISKYDVFLNDGSSTLGETLHVRLVGPTAPATSLQSPGFDLESAAFLASYAAVLLIS